MISTFYSKSGISENEKQRSLLSIYVRILCHLGHNVFHWFRNKLRSILSKTLIGCVSVKKYFIGSSQEVKKQKS